MKLGAVAKVPTSTYLVSLAVKVLFVASPVNPPAVVEAWIDSVLFVPSPICTQAVPTSVMHLILSQDSAKGAIPNGIEEVAVPFVLVQVEEAIVKAEGWI